MSVCDIDALTAHQVEAWNELLGTSPVRSPFLSHTFCRLVHDARGGGRVLQLKEDNGALGFLPFQMRKGRDLLGHGEKVGGGLSDMFGIVGAPHADLDARDLLRAANLSSLRFDHAVEQLCPFAFGDREETSGVRAHVEEFSPFLERLAQADREFVGMVGAGERRLAKKFGAIRFEWHAADAAAELDRLIEVKREQYLKTGYKDGLEEAWKRTLLHALLAQDSRCCRPVLSTLYAGDNWVSSHFGLTCGDTFHVWFPAYDPKFGRYGPGHMLLFKILEHGTREGYRWFDFGQGEATYKARYQGESYKLWKGSIRQRSLLGYSERVLQSLEWRIRGRNRDRGDTTLKFTPPLGATAS